VGAAPLSPVSVVALPDLVNGAQSVVWRPPFDACTADVHKVRPWIALLLVAGVVVLVIRQVMGHNHRIAIPLLLIPALVLGVQEYRFRQDDALFSHVASGIAGHPVTIECQRLSSAMFDVGSELGYVMFDANGIPENVGHIEREACNNLRDYTHSSKQWPSLDQVVGVAVLSHESQHLAGEGSEARAECDSIQDLAMVAQELGATPDQARQLAVRYTADVYPRMPDQYRSSLCVENGEWDKTPNDGVWP
jgi:hypothetical protein